VLEENLTTVSIVIERGRCRWGRCYFCGWGKRYRDVPIEHLKEKICRTLDKYENISTVKIFCSGSLLDPEQYPREFLEWLLKEVENRGIKHLIIESRPEFITEEALNVLRSYNLKVTVAIGLELADDNILLNYYRKGFTVKDYLNAVNMLRRAGLGVRTYILANGHPILYNNPKYHREVLHKTLKLAVEVSDSVVAINAYPHEESELIKDWIIMRWRPLTCEEFISMLGEWVNNPKIEVDCENFRFIPRIPKRMRMKIVGVGRDVLLHPHFEVWQDFILRFYKPPPDKKYLLFLPCTYRKPYSKSPTHRAILSTLRIYPWFSKLHLVVVSTPGVVPYEYHTEYPFTSYDWPEWLETPEVKQEYIEITRERVKKFLERNADHYHIIFAYFHLESETLQAIIQAVNELGLQHKFVNVLDEDTYRRIVNEIGKDRVGSSVLRHRLALSRLVLVLNKCIKSIEEKMREEKEFLKK